MNGVQPEKLRRSRRLTGKMAALTVLNWKIAALTALNGKNSDVKQRITGKTAALTAFFVGIKA